MFPEYARSVWDGVVGQQRAVAQLTHAAAAPVHAYLFVGPPGCTKDEAALAFAALLMAEVDDPEQRDARLVLHREHPDVREVERVGAKIAKRAVSHGTGRENIVAIEQLERDLHLAHAGTRRMVLANIPPAFVRRLRKP